MNLIRIGFSFIFFQLILFASNAQDISVRIRIINQKDQPVSYATITIAKRNDNLLMIKRIADSSGTASFVLKKDEQYIVKFTAIGYAPFEKGITVTGSQNQFR